MMEWTKFIDDMQDDCKGVNLKNSRLFNLIIIFRLIYWVIIKDREVLEAIIIKIWARKLEK